MEVDLDASNPIAVRQDKLEASSGIRSAPRWTMGGRTPRPDRDKDTPGPGEYGSGRSADMRYATQPKWRMGASKRPPLHAPSGTPGPGHYATTREKTRVARIPRAERLAQSAAASPGPAAYSPTVPKTAPMYGFGTGARTARTAAAAANDTPGPAEYLPGEITGCHEKTAVRMPAWQGGYRKPARPAEETPGPGKYEIPEKKTGPQYTMESRHHARKREPSPGPGLYNPVVKDSVPSYVIAGKPKERQDIGQAPGPGKYDGQRPDLTKSPGWSFGTSVRPIHEAAAVEPGPGEYDARDPRISTQAWSIPSAQREREDHSPVPGPGYYRPEDTKGLGPAYTMREKGEKLRDKTTSPGPGAYYTEKARGQTPEADVGYRFGKEKREKFGATSLAPAGPGPGQYTPVEARGPRGFSLTPRRKPKAVVGKTPQFQAARTQFHD